MTDDMMERVARAIDEAGLAWKRDNGGDAASWHEIPSEVFARAAIAAMREPTSKMKIAALEALIPHLDTTAKHVEQLIDEGHKWPWMTVGIRLGNSHVTDAVWHAAIDAALSTPQRGGER